MMSDSSRVENPHYPGSPARMSDGRLFTEYRGRCQLQPSAHSRDDASLFDARQSMMRNGDIYRKNDREQVDMRAARLGNVVDTMVPEVSKRVYTWAGPTVIPAHPIGIGSGRSYLPGKQSLIRGDPDHLAERTVPWMGSTSVHYSGMPSIERHSTGSHNRYSAPYF